MGFIFLVCTLFYKETVMHPTMNEYVLYDKLVTPHKNTFNSEHLVPVNVT